MALARITVLVSGRGSNLAAVIAASHSRDFNGAVTSVISSRCDASALAVAASHAIATSVVDPTAFDRREAFDAALRAALDRSEPDLIVLAGFMRVLGDGLVERYRGRMLNIHPSLLPDYPGLYTHRRALADRARVHGCTVHFVTPAVDGGPIVARATVDVHPDDTEATLAERVLEQEHRLLPAVVRCYCAGRLVLRDGRVRLDADGDALLAMHRAPTCP